MAQCVCAGAGRALSNEQHIHLMGLTFNQSTYSLSPTCLKKHSTPVSQETAHSYTCVWMSQQGGTDCWFTSFNNYHSGGGRNLRNEDRLRSRALPLMKIPELVELVGLAFIVSYHISPYMVHLSFWVTRASGKWLGGHGGAMLRSTWTGHRTPGKHFIFLLICSDI